MDDTETNTFDTSRYKVPSLNAENYFLWSHKMEFILRGKGLWDIVAGTEAEPADATAKAKYNRRRDVALTNIILSIDDKCSAAVITLRDPTVVWTKLKDMYKKVSDARIDAYMTQLHNTRMKSDEKVMEYVNRLMELENKLANVGQVLDASEKRRVLLRGLRNEFKITAEVIRAADVDYESSVSRVVTTEAEQESGDVENSDNEKKLNCSPSQRP